MFDIAVQLYYRYALARCQNHRSLLLHSDTKANFLLKTELCWQAVCSILLNISPYPTLFHINSEATHKDPFSKSKELRC